MYAIRFINGAGAGIHDAFYRDKIIYMSEASRIKKIFQKKKVMKSIPVIITDDYMAISVDLLHISAICYLDLKEQHRRADEVKEFSDLHEGKAKIGIHA